MAPPSPRMPPATSTLSPLASANTRQRGARPKSKMKITWGDTVDIQYSMRLGVKRILEFRLGAIFMRDVLQVLAGLLSVNDKDSVVSLLNGLIEGPPAETEHRVRTWLKSKILEFRGNGHKNLIVPPDLLQLLSVEHEECTILDAAVSVAKEPDGTASVSVPPLPGLRSRSQQQQVRTSENTSGSESCTSPPEENESRLASSLPRLRAPTPAVMSDGDESNQGSDDDYSPLAPDSFIRYSFNTPPSSSLSSDRFRSGMIADVHLVPPQPVVEAANAVVSRPTTPKPRYSYQRRANRYNHPVNDDDADDDEDAAFVGQEVDFMDESITSTRSITKSQVIIGPEILSRLMEADVDRQSYRPSKDKDVALVELRKHEPCRTETTENKFAFMASMPGDQESFPFKSTEWDSEYPARTDPYELNHDAESVARFLLANGPSAVAASVDSRSSKSTTKFLNTIPGPENLLPVGPRTRDAEFDIRRKYVSESWGGPSAYITGADSESNACAQGRQGDERVNAVAQVWRTKSESTLRECVPDSSEPAHQFLKPSTASPGSPRRPDKIMRLRYDLEPMSDMDLDPFMLPPDNTIRQDEPRQDLQNAELDVLASVPIEVVDTFELLKNRFMTA